MMKIIEVKNRKWDLFYCLKTCLVQRMRRLSFIFYPYCLNFEVKGLEKTL